VEINGCTNACTGIGCVGTYWSQHVRCSSWQHGLGRQMGNTHVWTFTSTFCLRPSWCGPTWWMGPDWVSPAEYALL